MVCTCHTNEQCISDTTFGKDNGVWKKKIAGVARGGGVWKKHNSMYVKDSGSYQKVFDQCTCNDRGGCSCNSNTIPGPCPTHSDGCTSVCNCVTYSYYTLPRECYLVGCGWNCATAADGSCPTNSNCVCFGRACNCMHYVDYYVNACTCHYNNPPSICSCDTQLGCHCDSRGNI